MTKRGFSIREAVALRSPDTGFRTASSSFPGSQLSFDRFALTSPRRLPQSPGAVDVQAIGGEVRVGVANCQAAQNRQFRRDSQLRPDGLRIPRDRDFDARPQASFGQGQQQRLQIHPHAQGVR
jgi:hypothetical protein